MDAATVLVVTARLLCKEGLENAFANHLKAFQKSIAHHEGLLSHTLYRCKSNPRLFLFFEQYDSQASYERHRDSPELQHWATIRDNHVEQRLVETWTLEYKVGRSVSLMDN